MLASLACLAQPDDPPSDCFPIDTCVPIDGGIGFLAAVGLAYGAATLLATLRRNKF